jgi:hypothetical protein
MGSETEEASALLSRALQVVVVAVQSFMCSEPVFANPNTLVGR